MNHSESLASIAPALVKAQAEMKAVAFDATNPFLKNKYASLGAVIETARPVLAKHGLCVSQLVTTAERDRIGVETIILHTSGEWIGQTAEMLIGDEKGKSLAQVAGSIISYLRRYSLSAALNMYADEDADGSAHKEAAPLTVEEAREMTTPKGAKLGTLDVEKLRVVIEKSPALAAAARLVLITDFNLEA